MKSRRRATPRSAGTTPRSAGTTPRSAGTTPRSAGTTARRRFQRRYTRYHLFLATMYDGNFLFTYFGHNAIRVVDRRRGSDLNYNFGTFGFDPSFTGAMTALYEYLQFKMKYWLGLARFYRSIRWYRRQDRTYNVRRLLLTSEEKRKLVRYLQWHARPKNRYYPYHHYTNNCSTKTRDALARILGPAFKQRAMVKRGRTYRSMVMDKVRPNPILTVLMDFGMGPPADKELTWWEEMFLPERLEEFLAQPFWTSVRGRPLVGAARVLNKRKEPRAWWQKLYPGTWMAIFTALWMLLGLVSFPTRFSRTWLRSLFFMMGLLGLALTGIMFFTQFPEPPGNANIFFYHPLHWVVWWWLGKRRWSAHPLRRTWVRWYVAVHLGGGAVYLLLKLLGWVPYQRNTLYILFVLLTFGLAAVQLWRDPLWGVVETRRAEPNAAAAPDAVAAAPIAERRVLP